MADVTYPSRTAFAFIEELKTRFKEKFTNDQILSASGFGLAGDFSETYKNLAVIPLVILELLQFESVNG